jgi:rhodanese-related sulfurtransferase
MSSKPKTRTGLASSCPVAAFAAKPVVVYCASGYRSSLAASLLQASGFREVQNVSGGYAAWTSAAFPVVKAADTHRKASDTER